MAASRAASTLSVEKIVRPTRQGRLRCAAVGDGHLCREVIQGLRRPVLREVRRAREEASTIVGNRPRDELRGRLNENAYRDVDPLGDDIDATILALQLHVEVGVPLLERGEPRRDHVRAVHRGRRYAQHAAHGRIARGRFLLERVELREQAPSARHIRPPGIRERHFSGRSLHEPDAEPRLDARDRLADRGRREREPRRGGGEGAEIGHRDENLQGLHGARRID